MWKLRDLDFTNEAELMKAIVAVRRLGRNPAVTTNDLTRIKPFLQFIEERPAALKLSSATLDAIGSHHQKIQPPEVLKYFVIENKVVQLFPSQVSNKDAFQCDTAFRAFEIQNHTRASDMRKKIGKGL